MDTWKPSVTVAAVIENGGRFLLVEEQTVAGVRLNQPAGHLEPGESLLEAVRREALEETGHHVRVLHGIGVYMSRYQSSRTGEDVTYLRFAFAGTVGDAHDRALDVGILRAVWLSYEEIVGIRDKHRSPLVLQCIDDYLRGRRLPLTAHRGRHRARARPGGQ